MLLMHKSGWKRHIMSHITVDNDKSDKCIQIIILKNVIRQGETGAVLRSENRAENLGQALNFCAKNIFWS